MLSALQGRHSTNRLLCHTTSDLLIVSVCLFCSVGARQRGEESSAGEIDRTAEGGFEGAQRTATGQL